MKNLKHIPIFERLKKTNKYGIEFWSAHELAAALGYTEYRHFAYVIKKAKKACENSNYIVEQHFEDGLEYIITKNQQKRKAPTVFLSRYACYLIVQNANPNKEVVALGQTYFAFQSRKQDFNHENSSTSFNTEEFSRLLLRNEMIRHNKELAKAARRAGVIEPEDFSAFQNHGYQGLYGGLDQRQLHKKKGLKKSEKVLDYMGSTELAANLFRATQTEEKLSRENIKGKYQANQAHLAVGQKIRQTIKELGGTMPEELPTPLINIKTIEHKQTKLLKKTKPDTSY